VPESQPTRSKIPGWPIAAVLAVLFIYLYYVRIVLLPFVVAGAVAFVLSPVVDRLHRWLGGAPRWIPATAIYLLVLIVIGALGYWLAPPIAADAADLARRAPAMVQSAIAYAAPNGQIALFGKTMSASALAQNALDGMRAYLLSGAGISLASAGLAAVFGAFLGFVLLAYFLISGSSLGNGLLWLVPPEYRDTVRRLTVEVGPMLRRYFIGLLIVVSYTAATAGFFFSTVFHIGHAPLLAVTIGVLELVPILGPMISASLVVLAAFQQTSFAMTVTIIVFVIVLRLSIDQVVGPLVLGRAAYLHPVAVIFAFLTGAVFLGVLGLILAVPVAATIKIVLAHYYSERFRRS
jgi:predicted PurR-regulated permease PerM